MREGRSIPVPIRFSWLLALTFDKKLKTMMKNDEVFGALKFWCDKDNEIKFDRKRLGGDVLNRFQ